MNKVIIKMNTEIFEEQHIIFMKQALECARTAMEHGEVPIGAVAVENGKIIAEAYNLKESSQNPVAHAEILLIQKVADIKKSWRLEGITVYSTLEPCVMCAAAMSHARIKECFFGAYDSKFGGAGSLYNIPEDTRLNHCFSCSGGLLEHESIQLLQTFFQDKRKRR